MKNQLKNLLIRFHTSEEKKTITEIHIPKASTISRRVKSMDQSGHSGSRAK